MMNSTMSLQDQQAVDTTDTCLVAVSVDEDAVTIDNNALNCLDKPSQATTVEGVHTSIPSVNDPVLIDVNNLRRTTSSFSSSSSISAGSDDGASIRWGNLDILEFPNVLGDHPGLTGGAPFSIGWDYMQRSTIDIEFYEHYRLHNPRRTRKQLHISALSRDAIALRLGYSLGEIFQVGDESRRIHKSRHMSMKGTKWTRFMNVFEKTTRGILGATTVGIGSNVTTVGASNGCKAQRKPSQPNTLAARSG